MKEIKIICDSEITIKNIKTGYMSIEMKKRLKQI
jgi:hypothetical protein